MAIAYLVAHMCWTHAKDPKGIDPYPPNHTFSIFSNMPHELGLCLRE